METEKEPLVELKQAYLKNKTAIKKHAEKFSKFCNHSEKKTFEELCFCICTPQSKATAAWFNVIAPLSDSGALYTKTEEELAGFMKNTGVRFHKTKAARIIKARVFFREKSIIDFLSSSQEPSELRDILVKNICGFGLKEASHFLRNIGLGKNLAILDRHILKNLQALGIIEKIPANLSRKKYLEIEKKMQKFSEECRIPLDELDLLLWFKETGILFK